MAAFINTNTASLNAQRNLNTSQSSLTTSLQRLSSGLRINSAKDDAAGLAISERFTTQIRGVSQAARNANDGISLAQTAEGTLGEIGNNLQRMRELAVQSRNSTNSADDRAALDTEVQQLKSEIGRVAGQANFNGTKLLDGSFTNATFQVGANQGETISITGIANANVDKLGAWTSPSTDATAASYKTNAISNLDFSTAAASATSGSATTDAITTFDFSGAGDAASFTVGGTAITLNTALVDADGVAAAINTQLTAANAGITATVGSSDELIFTKTATGAASTSPTIATDADSAAFAGVAAEGGKDAVTSTAAGFDVDGNTVALTGKFTTQAALATEIQTQLDASDAGAYTVAASDKGISITSNTAGAATAVEIDAFTGAGAAAFGGGTAKAGADKVIGTDTVGFAKGNVLDTESADKMILAMDAALKDVNSARAGLGAVQNRFSSVIANLQTTSENLSASRSRIQDTDFAAETASLTRGQILQQAGTAMLAQANSLPNGVLSLLRG